MSRKWGEYTGRAGLDWQPDLGFTDHTLLYASYSRGYKAGGINPPTPGYATGEDLVEAGYISQEALDNDGKFFDFYPVLYFTLVNYDIGRASCRDRVCKYV